MRILSIFLALLCSVSAQACPSLPASDGEAAQENIGRERKIATELSEASDHVFVGRVIALWPLANEQTRARFEVVESWKGQGAEQIEATAYPPQQLGCRKSDWFGVVPSLSKGATYVLYVGSGRVLRAASLQRERSSWQLSIEEEKSIVRVGT